MRILLAEDNELLGDGLAEALRDEGENVEWLKDGASVLAALKIEVFDLLVLDLGLPKMDGVDVLRALRSGAGICDGNASLPVLILTARDQISDKVTGLDAGADDYMVKPFDVVELMARVRALHRRAKGRSRADLEIEDLKIEPDSRQVWLAGVELKLSRREYAVLKVLAESPGKIITKDRLSEIIYGWGEEVGSNALEVHVHNLRKKLNGRWIKTVRGVGYQFVIES